MANAEPAPSGRWKFFLGLAPAVLFWAVLVAWLAYLLYDQTRWWRRTDEANLHEWLDESRNFRKSLPELIRDYVAEQRKTRDGSAADVASPDLQARADEIHEQLAAMGDPTRIYQGQLPLFPEIYRLQVQFADPAVPPITWDSPVPRPRQQGQVHRLEHPVREGGEIVARIVCEYRLHAYARSRRDEAERAGAEWMAGALVVVAGIVALIWVYTFLTRERRRELHQIRTQREKEHAERLLLENELRVREAENGRDE